MFNSVLGGSGSMVSGLPSNFLDSTKQSVLAMPTPRAKVSGWRILDSVLGGGKTISEAYDAERDRPAAEAAREMARQAAIQRQAMMDALPIEQRLPAVLNPEKFGEALASGFRTENVANGSVLASGAGGASFVNPRVEKFDDRFGTVNPAAPGGVVYTAPRGATYAEQTDNAYKQVTAGVAQQNANTSAFQAKDASDRGYQALDIEAAKVGGDPSVWAGGILIKMSSGVPLSPSEQEAWSQYKDMRRAQDPFTAAMGGDAEPGGAAPPVAPAAPAAPAPIKPGKGAGKQALIGAGTKAAPYMLTDPAQRSKLKGGQYYRGPDGLLRQVKAQ